MDCLHASEILSEAHDGELVDAALLAEAREHCAQCPECRAFADTLSRISAVPGPHASDELVARLISIAADKTAAAHADAAAPILVATARAKRPSRGMIAALASAAAVLLLAVAVGVPALLGTGGQQTAQDASVPMVAGGDDAAAEMLEGERASEEFAPVPSQIAAPPYVAFERGVWRHIEAAQPSPSQLTTVGVVYSNLGVPGATADRDAYFATGDDSTVYVLDDDGGYVAFKRVVRLLGRTEYGLVSESAIGEFGQWPQLPPGFATPTERDGSPAYRRFGFDDLNVDIYVPIGGRIENGFAVAPGTAPSDPAAGNPYWTWWERVP